MNCSLFVKNGPCFAGLGQGGAGFTSFTIASPTGEGITRARHVHPRAAVHAGGLLQDHIDELGRVDRAGGVHAEDGMLRRAEAAAGAARGRDRQGSGRRWWPSTRHGREKGTWWFSRRARKRRRRTRTGGSIRRMRRSSESWTPSMRGLRGWHQGRAPVTLARVVANVVSTEKHAALQGTEDPGGAARGPGGKAERQGPGCCRRGAGGDRGPGAGGRRGRLGPHGHRG